MYTFFWIFKIYCVSVHFQSIFQNSHIWYMDIPFSDFKLTYLLRNMYHLTVLEHSVYVQSIGGARLVIRTSFQVRRKLPGPRVVYHPRIGFTYGVCINTKNIIFSMDTMLLSYYTTLLYRPHFIGLLRPNSPCTRHTIKLYMYRFKLWKSIKFERKGSYFNFITYRYTVGGIKACLTITEYGVPIPTESREIRV